MVLPGWRDARLPPLDHGFVLAEVDARITRVDKLVVGEVEEGDEEVLAALAVAEGFGLPFFDVESIEAGDAKLDGVAVLEGGDDVALWGAKLQILMRAAGGGELQPGRSAEKQKRGRTRRICVGLGMGVLWEGGEEGEASSRLMISLRLRLYSSSVRRPRLRASSRSLSSCPTVVARESTLAELPQAGTSVRRDRSVRVATCFIVLLAECWR